MPLQAFDSNPHQSTTTSCRLLPSSSTNDTLSEFSAAVTPVFRERLASYSFVVLLPRFHLFQLEIFPTDLPRGRPLLLIYAPLAARGRMKRVICLEGKLSVLDARWGSGRQASAQIELSNKVWTLSIRVESTNQELMVLVAEFWLCPWERDGVCGRVVVLYWMGVCEGVLGSGT
ncbi:hypothetical protein BaRGS_00014692 [Batillaria attramentaria]|uniref:Uncharacterized protein n=1 Tax=Batillaria attramentaria TaxID=370345 RepID=A0ABD0L4I8_9CAEN